jgi:hypothetical protein
MPKPVADDRRRFLATAATAATVSWWSLRGGHPNRASADQAPSTAAPEVLYPRDRVPLSFIIDDSTSLVNMAHFCMPQFAQTWPDRAEYQKPWQRWPREIPDDFLREFGEWCAVHGVRGKFSMVPYPACVGWLDRELPGWSKRALQDSLALVRDLIVPSWDIHPEMITHTRVIDLQTGRPLNDTSPGAMENWYPETEISTDQLAAYLAFALRILRECGLPCEGVTTPGGFANRVRDRLPQATYESVRDVFGAELPHYFKDVIEGTESTLPDVPPLAADKTLPAAAINVPAGTGDWFGGWDGDSPCESERYATSDASGGRMVELIERGQPAVMLCHWPGLYNHGTADGFHRFQQIVLALRDRFGDRTQWLKLSELARWAAARQWTSLTPTDRQIDFDAPIACPAFTLAVDEPALGGAAIQHAGQHHPLAEVSSRAQLAPGTWCRQSGRSLVCFDLPAGASAIAW